MCERCGWVIHDKREEEPPLFEEQNEDDSRDPDEVLYEETLEQFKRELGDSWDEGNRDDK